MSHDTLHLLHLPNRLHKMISCRCAWSAVHPPLLFDPRTLFSDQLLPKHQIHIFGPLCGRKWLSQIIRRAPQLVVDVLTQYVAIDTPTRPTGGSCMCDHPRSQESSSDLFLVCFFSLSIRDTVVKFGRRTVFIFVTVSSEVNFRPSPFRRVDAIHLKIIVDSESHDISSIFSRVVQLSSDSLAPRSRCGTKESCAYWSDDASEDVNRIGNRWTWPKRVAGLTKLGR